MEKKQQLQERQSRRCDLIVIYILVLLILTLICFIFVTWNTGPKQQIIDIQETIVESIAQNGENLRQIQYDQRANAHHQKAKGIRLMKRLKREALRYQAKATIPSRRRLNRTLVLSQLRQSLRSGRDPEMDMTTCQIVQRWGYKCQSHSVTTEDGYILTLHRMPPSDRAPNQTGRGYPVFLQHGLSSSSADWVDNLPNISLAYQLHNDGYDVWMGNSRGNCYSRRHQTLDPEKRPYWRFSWDEMAAYDLPAMIDFVLKFTGHRDLFYAGHSQGTMIAFAQFSQNQQVGDRVRMFFALAPVTTVGHMNSVLFNTLSPFINELRDILYGLGFKGEFMPKGDWLIKDINEVFCTHPVLDNVCDELMWIIAGVQSSNINQSRIPVYLSQTPAGTSIENMVHFGQMVESKKFQKYNYGSEAENMKHYNQTTPPLYDISTLKTPLTVYWGGKDWLADLGDVLGLFEKVRHIEHTKFIPEYDHCDFIWGTSANDLIYKDMLRIMRNKLPGIEDRVL